MSRMDAKSLFLRLMPPAPRNLILPMREHDASRLPTTCRSSRPSPSSKGALQVIVDFRKQLRLAEEMVAKLGFQMRELQVLKPAPDVRTMPHPTRTGRRGGADSTVGPDSLPTVAKILRLKARAQRGSSSSQASQRDPDKLP